MMRRTQRGVAIVVAILLVALAASIAAFMLAQHDLWARQVENLGLRMQADAAARAGLAAARFALADASAAADPAPVRAMAVSVLPHVDDAALDIDYSDAQGVFNVNNLVRDGKASIADVEAFAHLLAGLGLAPELAAAAVDSIDGDSEVTVPGGAEDLDYLSMTPPRRAANQPVLEAGSLARVKGFTPDALARIRGLVSALPEATAINVNTAPAAVLMAVIPGLGIEDAARVTAARNGKPFADMAAFRASLPEKLKPLAGIALDVRSRYYVVTSRARVGRAEVAYQALIGRRGAARSGVVWSREIGA